MQAPGGSLRVTNADALTAPWTEVSPPDLVFIDPPYEIITAVAPRLFARLTELLQAHPDPVIVFEMPGGLTLEAPGWTEVRRLGKGAHQPTVAFFKRT